MGALIVSTTATTDESVAVSLTFDVLVYASAAFVGAAALIYTGWVLLYHEHAHEHPLLETSGHKHTTQQLRALEKNAHGGARTHVHLYLHLPWRTVGMGEHDHGHGHDHDHDHGYVYHAA